MKRYLSLSLSSPQLLLALSLSAAVACSDDGESDKKKELPVLPTLTSPEPQPRTGPSDASATAALTLSVEELAGTWLDRCKNSDQGSSRFVFRFQDNSWTTYVFKYASPDCAGALLQADGGARNYKLTLKPAQNGWTLASGSCMSDANGCKGEKLTALRLVSGRLETKNVKTGSAFNPDDSSPIYTYDKGELPVSDDAAVTTTPSQPAQPMTPVSLSPAASRFVKIVQGTWIPQECIKDQRNPGQSLKYVIMFVQQEFKTDIYRYKNEACEGAPETKPDGVWTFKFTLNELESEWFALDAQRSDSGSGSKKTQRLFNLEGNVLRQYRLKDNETFESLQSKLEQLKTDKLEKLL